MTYRLIVGTQAQADIRLAAQWYEEQRTGLGRALVRQIDLVLERVRTHPERYQVIYRQMRRGVARRFPYGVFYRIDGETVVVFAVLDLRRDPAAWQERVEPDKR